MARKRKFKTYRVIGSNYNCVYYSALASKSEGVVIREIEERGEGKVESLQHTGSYWSD